MAGLPCERGALSMKWGVHMLQGNGTPVWEWCTSREFAGLPCESGTHFFKRWSSLEFFGVPWSSLEVFEVSWSSLEFLVQFTINYSVHELQVTISKALVLEARTLKSVFWDDPMCFVMTQLGHPKT
jgi:hypothetical protein